MAKRDSHKSTNLIKPLLVALLILIVGATGWYVWHVKTDTDKTLQQVNASSETQATSRVITTPDKKVLVRLPNTWHVIGVANDAQVISINKNTHLCDKYDPSNCSAVAPCLDSDDTTSCIYTAEFQPKKFNATSDQTWNLTVEKTDWTIPQASESLLGELSSENTIEKSTDPINGYNALYIKIGMPGAAVGDYTDIHYFIEKDGYLLHFSSREKFDDHSGRATWDNSSYSADFAKIVGSVKLQI